HICVPQKIAFVDDCVSSVAAKCTLPQWFRSNLADARFRSRGRTTLHCARRSACAGQRYHHGMDVVEAAARARATADSNTMAFLILDLMKTNCGARIASRPDRH